MTPCARLMSLTVNLPKLQILFWLRLNFPDLSMVWPFNKKINNYFSSLNPSGFVRISLHLLATVRTRWFIKKYKNMQKSYLFSPEGVQSPWKWKNTTHENKNLQKRIKNEENGSLIIVNRIIHFPQKVNNQLNIFIKNILKILCFFLEC